MCRLRWLAELAEDRQRALASSVDRLPVAFHLSAWLDPMFPGVVDTKHRVEADDMNGLNQVRGILDSGSSG